MGIILRTGEISQVGVGPDPDDDRPVILAHGALRRWIGAQSPSRLHEYCCRMNARSRSDNPLFSPIEKPSLVQVAGIGYIMIESGSSSVKLVSCALCGWN